MDRTQWNDDWSAAIARVGNLVESLFSCRVRFQSIETFLDKAKADALFAEQDLVFFESTLFEVPSVVRSVVPGTVAYPLRVRRTTSHPASADVSLVGVATVERLAAFDDRRLNEIGEFLQLAVEARLDAFERLLTIEQQEQELEREQKLRESRKVIQLFPRAATESSGASSYYSGAGEAGSTKDPMTEKDDAFAFDEPLLIVSPTLQTDRIALELFNRSSLWFFVKIEDLHPDVFATSQSVRDLGRMCIFISDLSSISIEKQVRLSEVFSAKSKLGPDSPRLIAALRKPASQLVESGKLLPHLAELFIHVEPAAELTDIRLVVSFIERHLRGDVSSSNLLPFQVRNVGEAAPESDPNGNGRPPTFH